MQATSLKTMGDEQWPDGRVIRLVDTSLCKKPMHKLMDVSTLATLKLFKLDTGYWIQLLLIITQQILPRNVEINKIQRNWSEDSVKNDHKTLSTISGYKGP
jgi:hypothetical protein